MNAYSDTRRPLRAAVAALLVLGAAACGGGEGEAAETTKAPEKVTVLAPDDVAAAAMTELAAGVALTGSLEPFRTAEVKAQVPGVVRGLSVDRGSGVRAGQVLARIEAAGIQSQAAGARSGVAAAQAQLSLAQRQLESARTLFQAGAMSELDFRAAEAQFQAAQAQLAAARSTSTGAAEQAGRTAVTAPFGGQVSERTVNEGEAVNPGQTLLTVVNSQFLELRGQVPVDQANLVRPGQPAEFTLTAFPGQTFTGTVARVDPVADASTRQVGVTLRLPNPGQLIAGMFASGRVVTAGGRQALVVPSAAVRGTGADQHVLVLQGDSVVRRPVTPGSRDDARGVVAIESGLQAGEQVIVSPGMVPAGSKVRVQTAAAAAPAAAPAKED
ncbi:MAG TPA: efflux RND transporter periplasmic adaptor subunit [Longimicrobium sp.]|jgi:RND family efflux transporter MFP subunit|uniref:efflux RND transporter periplasmic adaptor subunit n=1 Tax=Longimicrobium sp. TaxID=2029185 RepID=UPI002EDBB2E5